MNQNSTRPIAVTIATAMFAIALIGGMLAAYAITDVFTFKNVTINFFIILPLLFIIYRIHFRDNVARWLMTFISAVMLSVLIAANNTSPRTTNTAVPDVHPAAGYISPTVGCFFFIGVVLMFLPRSNQWFRANAQHVA